MDDIFTQKNPKKFECIKCAFVSSSKKDFDKHLLTLKHSRMTQGLQMNDEKPNTIYFNRECGREYKHRQGLWKHKKICDFFVNNKQIINSNKDNLIIELLKQNKELLEIVKNGTYNNSNNTTHTNSHNKAFNLQFFLNETCKDAMNIMDFVESIKLELSDLENVGEVGYIEGISNIIVKNLKELDVTKRPVHCTDKKRETVYIKDDDKWEKDENKIQMHKLIKKVVSKNHKMIPKFKEAHPDCLKYHSKFSDQYNKIIYESMGGKGNDDFEKNEKIIKNVLKEVVVNKNI